MPVCPVCDTTLERKPRARKDQVYCSKKCRNKGYYQATGAFKHAPRRFLTALERKERKKEYDRTHRRPYDAKRRAYQVTYNRRPEVRERNRMRWHNDPVYREQALAAWRARYYKANPRVEIPAPYTGHIWLDMARKAVNPTLDSSKLWADDYHDEMGEAVLALLEGRDMREAVKEYRRKEYVPRRLTIHLGDWGDDEEQQNRWFESVMPKAQSAEDEALDREAVVTYAKTRFSNVAVGSKNRKMKNKQNQPTRRRMNNGKGWRRTGALG